jgi:nitroreductase
MNEHIALLLSHRSIRGYRPDALPPGTLETLVAAAQSAATSSNLQTWSVVAVTDAGKKATLARLAANQKHIEQCPLFLVWIADLSRNRRLAEEEGVTLETLPYQETFLVAAIDATLAAQNATVAAESLGLSTVYIGALRNPATGGGRGRGPAAWRVRGVRHVRRLCRRDRGQRGQASPAAGGGAASRGVRFVTGAAAAGGL